MDDIRKWITLSSKKLDDFRLAWEKKDTAESKLQGFFDENTLGAKDFFRANYIFWGELHFLYLALHNLCKAIKNSNSNDPKASEAEKLIKKWSHDIRLLRDINEHWEQKNNRSLSEFNKKHPNKSPHTVTLIPFKKFAVSGIEIDVNELQGVINKLEELYELY